MKIAIQAEEGEGSRHPSEPQPPPSTDQPTNEELTPLTADSLDVEAASGGSPRCQEAMGGSIAQTRSERVPTQPYDSPLPRVESLEADLKQTKKVYGAAYTKLIKKVKKLEKIVKSNQARRRANIVVSDDEEDLEDSSNKGG
ncbi:hypothetical protein Tco_1123631 [Tanacetum coccineum]|uniref:Uncharacterized protein n=1 Tax=Tanacetum coccineum TaxID=301880 RepID=A0ABQ5J4F9_9ASTR